jgi:hypothetical protein
MIEAQLPDEYSEIAKDHGLLKRKAPPQLGAKVDDISQVLRLVFFHVATNSSLRVTTAMAAAAGIVDISPVALHLWMRKLGLYLATLLELTTSTRELFAPERWAGYDVRVVDASTVTRPGACTTTARVHYGLKLTSLRPEQLEVTDETGGETFRRFEAEPGPLWLGDRGYANPPGIAWICSNDADVLVRHNRGSLPLYDVHAKRLDVAKRLSRLTKPGRPREWAAWVHAEDGERIRGRLCAVRLPADKAEEARQRLRKEHGSQVSKEALKAAGFVVVFTTVAAELLGTEAILERYGLRWQVELHIKRDKSIACLGQLPNFREDTIFSWLCAKLLLVEIARKITSTDVVFPRCA